MNKVQPNVYLEDVNELATAERENENPCAAVEAENPPNNAETEARRRSTNIQMNWAGWNQIHVGDIIVLSSPNNRNIGR